MNSSNKTTILIGILAIIAIVGWLGLENADKVKAGGNPGFYVNFATSTVVTAVKTNPGKVFATSTLNENTADGSWCRSRSITVNDTAGMNPAGVMLSFNDSVPSANTGHWQGASTTVVYDAEEWGCGAVRTYGNTTLTVTEFR